MHLLIVGGSPHHLGGVEAFCDRSRQALAARNPDWRIHYIPTDTAYLTWRRLPALVRGLGHVWRYRRQRPDIVWVQYSALPDLVYLAFAKLLGFRAMVTPHLGSNWRSQSNPFLRALSGWLLGGANRLALISKTQELEINLPPHVPRSLIRNFLPPAVLAAAPAESGPSADTMQLIHSGRLSEGKGTFMLIEVCRQLKAAGLPFHTRITGGADEATFERLYTMIAEYDLGEQVAVLGRVSEDELLATLRASDILVHLSSIDSYPLIVLESLTCAVFPVCMELAGARDMIETYDGHVVSVAGAVKETVAFLSGLSLHDIRTRTAIAGSRVREDYSWQRCASVLEHALQATRESSGR